MGGSQSRNIGNQISHALNPNTNGVAKAFNPNTNGVAKAFNPNTNGVAKAFAPVAKVVTQTIPNAITKTIPAAAVTTAAVLSKNLNPATNGVASSFAQVPAAVSAVPVIGQLPITQLLTGNTSGFVNSLQNVFAMGVNTLGLGSVVSTIPGLGFVNPILPQQPIYTGGPTFIPNPTNGGGPGNAATSSGSDPGQYAQPGSGATSSSVPNYTELLLIAGAISALVILR